RSVVEVDLADAGFRPGLADDQVAADDGETGSERAGGLGARIAEQGEGGRVARGAGGVDHARVGEGEVASGGAEEDLIAGGGDRSAETIARRRIEVRIKQRVIVGEDVVAI